MVVIQRSVQNEKKKIDRKGWCKMQNWPSFVRNLQFRMLVFYPVGQVASHSGGLVGLSPLGKEVTSGTISY